MKLQNSEQEALKSNLVERLITQNARCFATLLESSGLIRESLDVPDEALAYLIPRSLLLYAEKPETVRVVPVVREKDGLLFVIVEQCESKIKQVASRAVISGTKDALIKQGVIGDKETVSMRCEVLLKPHPNTAYVSSYETRDEFLGNFFVAKEFFSRLERVLKGVGVKYIWGMNSEENKNFFLKVLKRKDLTSASAEVKNYLLDTSFIVSPAGCTYKELT